MAANGREIFVKQAERESGGGLMDIGWMTADGGGA